MDATIKAEWQHRLRSGLYPQTSGVLNRPLPDFGNNRPAGFCCLGVLCEMAVEAGIVDRIVDPSLGYVEYVACNDVADLDTGVLPRAVQLWAGLTEPNPSVRKDPEDRSAGVGIAAINDRGATFAAIADLIEQL